MGVSPKGRGRAESRAHIHTITLPLLFPLFPVNVYLIDGDLPTLIDAGLNTDVAWEGLVKGLAAAGRRIADIKRVILTHGHIDHAGLTGRLCEEGNPDILIHEGDAERICSDVECLVGRLEVNAVRLVKMGIRKRDVDKILRTYVSMLRRFSVHLDDVLRISDGSVIEFSDFTLEVMHSPGHTPGSICLFDKRSRVLFSGDHVMEGTSTNPLIEMSPEEGVGLSPYLSSLERVQRRSPARILAGHGNPIGAAVRHIEGTLRYHDQLRKEVIGALGAEWTTPVALAEVIFPNLGGIYSSNVAFEIYCHLTELVGQGRAVVQDREGGYYFKAAESPVSGWPPEKPRTE